MFFKLAIPGLFFLYFCLFSTVDSKQMFNIKVCRIMDSNRSTNCATTTDCPVYTLNSHWTVHLRLDLIDLNLNKFKQ